ncbi:hypothetical protein [Paenibacillus thalictri]|uniref:hypothetical protein n=1 Tax=Paenibacillus thalictri TaxID=2527873 RepID=UPI0013EEF5DB|nr:hypothetical protein [Paenibacillus thalictri]
MAASMRERPHITGKDADKLIARINHNSNNMRKKIERKMDTANQYAQGTASRSSKNHI